MSNSLHSLNVSELEALIASHPMGQTPQIQAFLTQPQGFDEKTYDRERKRKQRASGRDLHIPVPKNLELRRRCLEDAQLFMRSYLADEFDEEFTEDRAAMLNSIIHAAKYGGDQAIAGTRGEGKTTIAMNGAFWLMIRRLSTFPVVIGKNQDSSSDELHAIREKLQTNERFIEDFPEIGVPLDAIGPSTASARLMTVADKPIGCVLGQKFFALPNITKEQLPHWPSDIEPVSVGQVMGALGIDGRIRGAKFRGKRPTVAVIDDVEDRQAADSDPLIEKNEDTIEKDIAGLGRGSERIARVMLCTIQNRKCIAYKYTDPKQKPSWKGKRYRKMIQPPDRMDLVEEYIQMRIEKASDDPDARVAFRFWRDNQEKIEFGCKISNPQSFSKKIHEDGEPLELSAIQAYYNRVADWGKDAVATEVDNDPPETIGPQGMGLTPEIVVSRLSGLDRCQVPANAVSLTAAIDLGKYRCHWVVMAWWKGAGGCVVDYGVAEVTGTNTAIDNEASEPHIYKALLDWRDQLLQKKFVDSAGAERSVEAVFVDSGTYTNAAYEFVRQTGAPFHVVKGIGNYRPRKKSTETTKAGDHMHAEWLAGSRVWLFEIGTDYWKKWVHERFLTPTFDENNFLRRGALSMFVQPGNKKHSSYAQHITAEELVTEFKEGKGTKTYWNQTNDNNHWLDATYYAAAAGRFSGVHLLSESEGPKIEPRHTEGKAKQPKPKPAKRVHHGTRLRTRPGGWVQGARRRNG